MIRFFYKFIICACVLSGLTVYGLAVADGFDSTQAPADSLSAETTENAISVDSTLSLADSLAALSDNSEPIMDSSWWTRKIHNRAFGLGERLEFSVKYGSISAGNAVMEISETTMVDNHPCYRVVSTANSNDFISLFYKVRDSVQTYLDVPGLFPHLFMKHLREGGYKNDRLTAFDQKNHLAITGKDTIPTYSFVQDPLSALYFVRTQELVPGKDISIDSHADRKNYPILIKVLKRDRVEVPAGKFDCVVVEPVMRAEGIFKAKGNIKIWLTDDEYKMPVMMKTEVYFLGSINAQLSKYKRGRILDGQVQEN